MDIREEFRTPDLHPSIEEAAKYDASSAKDLWAVPGNKPIFVSTLPSSFSNRKH